MEVITMPRGDKTGPEGKGSMTGRGLGSCGNKNGNTGNQGNTGRGMGAGKGMGARRNPRNAN
jgi:hypothetical protein